MSASSATQTELLTARFPGRSGGGPYFCVRARILLKYVTEAPCRILCYKSALLTLPHQDPLARES